MSRTWKDVTPELRLTAKRFTEQRGVRGRRRASPGERYSVVLRAMGQYRPGRREWGT